MRTIETLLARACVPLCFIQLLKLESERFSGSIDNIFLHLLLAFTTVWIGRIAYSLRPSNSSFHGFISGFLLIFSLFSIFNLSCYLHEEYGAKKYLILDCGLPYLNMNQLLQWTCSEIWNLVFFFYRYLFIHVLGNSTSNIVCYFFTVATRVILFTFIINFVLIESMAKVNLFLMDNFVYSYDGRYAKGQQNPLAFDSKTFDFAIDDGSYAFKYKTIHKYKGEDVEMICGYIVKKQDVIGAKRFPPIWYFNDTEALTKNNSNYVITNDFFPDGQNVEVTSSLKRTFLRDSDFGHYACKNTLESHTNKSKDLHDFIKPSLYVFKLKQINIKEKLVHKVVGNLIACQNFFPDISIGEIYEKYIAYTINGRPVEEVCPGFQTQVCSLGASMLISLMNIRAKYFLADGEEISYFAHIGELLDSKSKTGIFYFCLCSAGYGVHRFSFKSAEHVADYVNVEIAQSDTFVVLPFSKSSLFRLTDDSHLYSDIEKLIQSNSNLDIIEHEIQQLIPFVQANEDKVLFFANVAQAFFLALLLITFHILSFVVSNLYIKQFFIRYVTSRYCINRPLPRKTVKKEYDIFISSSDIELTFVTDTVIPVIENECNLSCCFPDRDFLGNMDTFHTYPDRIEKSRKIIVILSHAFMKDELCIRFQIDKIILPLLYLGYIPLKDILFIIYDKNIDLPKPLSWNTQVKVISWFTHLQEHEKIWQLKRWLKKKDTPYTDWFMW